MLTDPLARYQVAIQCILVIMVSNDAAGCAVVVIIEKNAKSIDPIIARYMHTCLSIMISDHNTR